MDTIDFIRGDTVPLSFAIKDDNGDLIGLEKVDTLYLTARQYADEGSAILFSKKKEDFVIADNKYQVVLQPTDTEQIYTEQFQFDIEVTLYDGTRKTQIYQMDMTKDYTIHGGDENEH